MSLTLLLPQTVTIVRYNDGALDADRNFVRGEASRVDVPARLRQIDATEPATGPAGLLDRWRLYLPAGTDISASDQVFEGGRLFQVDGSPYRVIGRVEHHVECNLLYVSDIEQTPANISVTHYGDGGYGLGYYGGTAA